MDRVDLLLALPWLVILLALWECVRLSDSRERLPERWRRFTAWVRS